MRGRELMKRNWERKARRTADDDRSNGGCYGCCCTHSEVVNEASRLSRREREAGQVKEVSLSTFGPQDFATWNWLSLLRMSIWATRSRDADIVKQ